MKTRIISLIAIIAILSGCHKNAPATKDLEGTWKYIGFDGGLVGFRFTPATTETYIQFHGTGYIKNTNGNQNCGSFSFIEDSNSVHVGLVIYDTSRIYSVSSNQYDAYLLHDTLRLYPHNTDDGFNTYYIPSSKHLAPCSVTLP